MHLYQVIRRKDGKFGASAKNKRDGHAVCAADTDPSDPAGKRYVVTLRPLLPGEQP